jgi:DNA polymerase-1
LIQEFGSIEELYERIDEVSKNSVKEKLISGKDMAFMSKGLATIYRDMDICDLDSLHVNEPDREKLKDLFDRLEFRSLKVKYGLDKIENTSDKVGEETYSVSVLDINGLSDYLTSLKSGGKISFYTLFDKHGFSSTVSGIAMTADSKKIVFVSVEDNRDEEKLVEALKPFFEDEKIIKYTHDVKSLYLYLHRKGIVLKAAEFDTLLAAYLDEPSSSSYDIDKLARIYLGKEVKSTEDVLGKGKSAKSYRDLGIEEKSSLAASYVSCIYSFVEVLSKKIEETNQHELYYNIELPLAKVLSDMEFHGFKVNVNDLLVYSGELDAKIKVTERTIYEQAGENFNINSPKQLGVILFEKLGLPVIKKTKTGYSTDAEVLEQLMDKHEIVENITNYRQLMKLKSTYVEGLMAVINPETGKIHSSFNQTIASTGRISSTEPNLQNIPIKLELGRKIRKVFVPTDSSYSLVDADYSQIELRVLAHIADDANMIKAFTDNEDIHTSTAAKVFGVAPEDVTPKMRSNAKAVNFGIVYGIGDFSLSRDLGITRKEARAYIDGYLDKYPGVRDYMKNIVAFGKEHGFVTTMFNRRRYLPELKSSNFNIRSFGERIAMNTPIQGSAADIIKIAMVKVYNALENGGFKSRLILQVHDELIIETAKNEEAQVKEILKNCMEQAVSLKVPLTVDVKSGSNWYESK